MDTPKVFTVNAGSRPAYEVLEDANEVIFRVADAPSSHFRIVKVAIPELLAVLVAIEARRRHLD
jgi:hypothetical protein